jgi:hypothetical protein
MYSAENYIYTLGNTLRILKLFLVKVVQSWTYLPYRNEKED